MNLESAEGYLVGEPHRGMRSMFTMMNAARLQVGGEGVALGEAAYQAALSFAKDRLAEAGHSTPKTGQKCCSRQHLFTPMCVECC